MDVSGPVWVVCAVYIGTELAGTTTPDSADVNAAQRVLPACLSYHANYILCQRGMTGGCRVNLVQLIEAIHYSAQVPQAAKHWFVVVSPTEGQATSKQNILLDSKRTCTCTGNFPLLLLAMQTALQQQKDVRMHHHKASCMLSVAKHAQ